MSNLKAVLGRWSNPLSELERGHHLNYVINMLNPLFDSGIEICPARENVFRVFDLFEPEALRVVILGMDPYNDGIKATGVAFGNPEETLKISPSLKKIEEEVERTVKGGLNLDFDITLEKWAKQGVLLINSAMTVERGNPGSHMQVWKKFTETMISELSRNFDNLYFCFWMR